MDRVHTMVMAQRLAMVGVLVRHQLVPTRVRMLWALGDTELDVSSLAAIAECRPTVASQHLSKLRFADLVEGERQGQRVVYRLRGGHVRALLVEALFDADHQKSGQVRSGNGDHQSG